VSPKLLRKARMSRQAGGASVRTNRAFRCVGSAFRGRRTVASTEDSCRRRSNSCPACHADDRIRLPLPVPLNCRCRQPNLGRRSQIPGDAAAAQVSLPPARPGHRLRRGHKPRAPPPSRPVRRLSAHRQLCPRRCWFLRCRSNGASGRLHRPRHNLPPRSSRLSLSWENQTAAEPRHPPLAPRSPPPDSGRWEFVL
jgi:hypothetical protein